MKRVRESLLGVPSEVRVKLNVTELATLQNAVKVLERLRAYLEIDGDLDTDVSLAVSAIRDILEDGVYL